MTAIDDPTDPAPWANHTPNPRHNRAPTQVAPHDPDAEQALLSAALTNPQHVTPLLQTLPDNALYHPTHNTILHAILQLTDDGIEPDPVTVAARLRQQDELDTALTTLLDIAAVAAPPTSAPGYAQIIRDHHRRRTTLALAGELQAAARDGHHNHVATLLEQALAQVTDPDGQPCAAALLNWDTIWDTDRDDAEWLAEPLLARGRGHAIYATAKAGKSLLLLEVAAAIATGRTVLDQPAGNPQNVVYFDLEMTEADVIERLTDLGYSRDDDLSHLHYYLLPNLAPLDTAEGGRTVERIATAHQADLVLFDTTSRVVEGPESEADTFRAFYRHTGIRLKAAGITYVRLDHAGKELERGQRGSSAKADDVDVVWEMTPTDSGVRLKATHSRMAWVEKTIDLLRLTDPLIHRRIAAAWPAGTNDKAAQLDRLGVPLDATRAAARKAITAANETPGKNDILAAALRWRREKPPGDPTSPNTGSDW